jgi:hypothetical protein
MRVAVFLAAVPSLALAEPREAGALYATSRSAAGTIAGGLEIGAGAAFSTHP